MFQVYTDTDENPLDGLSDPQKGFLSDVFAKTMPGDGAFERVWEAPHGPVTFSLCATTGFHAHEKLKPDEIHLKAFRASVQGVGDGREAMEFITQLADEHRIAICLQALPYIDCRMGEYSLMEWYKGHGFEKYRGSHNPMWREPSAP